MPSRELIRRSVEAKMRRGRTRQQAQRDTAAELGVALADIQLVPLQPSDPWHPEMPV